MGANKVAGCGRNDCSAIYNLDDLNTCFECNVSNNTLSCNCCEDDNTGEKCKFNASDVFDVSFNTSATLCTDEKTKIKNNNGSLENIECITWFSDNWMTVLIIIVIIVIVVAFFLFGPPSKNYRALNEAKNTFGLDINSYPFTGEEKKAAMKKFNELKETNMDKLISAKQLLKNKRVYRFIDKDFAIGGAKGSKGSKGSKGYKGSKGSKAKGGRY